VPRGLKRRSIPQHNISKVLEGVTHSSEASGATPGGCARTHLPESDDATTLVHNSLSLCESVHTRAKPQGLLSGT
jgi:hypothetical protein